MAEQVTVELIYPLPHEQILFAFVVDEGATIREGILASGVLDKYPELDIEAMKVGIFGKLAPMTTKLRAKDRIEIYRPLIADPKEVRKQRAAAGKRMKKGGGDADGGSE